MTEQRVCDYEECSERFIPKRPHQRFHSEPCRYAQWELDRLRGGASGAGQRVDGQAAHPLQAVRDQAALDKHTRDLNGLIRQAIIDAIKTRGECHADDLHDLYPEGEVDRCRELATRQFASLRSGKRPLIEERERRPSSIPARKRAKSGVYVFTQHGRETLVGSSSGAPGGTGVATARSGESEIVGVGTEGEQTSSDTLGANSGEKQSGAGPTLPLKNSASPPTRAVTGSGSPDHPEAQLLKLEGEKPKPRNAIFDDDWGEAA